MGYTSSSLAALMNSEYRRTLRMRLNPRCSSKEIHKTVIIVAPVIFMIMMMIIIIISVGRLA